MIAEPGRAGARPPLRVVERDDPSPGAGEVAIDIHACALCRTDLQLAAGDIALARRPIIPGHQGVGQVVEIGPGWSGLELGDRVGIGWLGGACGACRFCASERENLCAAAEFTGWHRDGAFATRVVARADFVFPIPEGFGDLTAAPLLCGGVIGYRAFRLAGVGAGARLGLYGFGASARLTLAVARSAGCEVYVATRSAEEQARALELGAVWAGRYGDAPPRPLDAAITFAPSGDVVVDALRALDRGGVVVVNAIHLDRIPTFPYAPLWLERQIRSVANYTREDARAFLELAAKINLATSIEVISLTDLDDALGRLERGEVRGTPVVDLRRR